MKILLDYVFPISVITPTPAASTAFLKQACLVVKPAAGQEGNVGNFYLATSDAEVAARTDNENALQMFAAGMTRVYLLLADSLDDIDGYLTPNTGNFYTLLISDDFEPSGVAASGTIGIDTFANLLVSTPDTIEVAGVTFTAQAGAATPGDATFQAASSDEETAQSLADQINAHATTSALVLATVVDDVVTVTALAKDDTGNALTLVYTDNGAEIGATVSGSGTLAGGLNPLGDVGDFPGVVGIASNDTTYLAVEAAKEDRCAFYTSGSNGAENMAYAFGKLLSNALNWNNQQYIEMPLADDVDSLGEAENLFDSRISFVISDAEFGDRLGFFVAGGRAITAPYILKNLRVDIQSRTLQYISANQPDYTLKEASLLETALQEDVIELYITRTWITAGIISIGIEQENFVASGDINVSEPRALWRVFGEMQQTL